MDAYAGKPTTSGRSKGSRLLQLPTEILQLIARYITASEWARGPCLACRSLCNLELQELTLYPVIDVSGMSYIEKCPRVSASSRRKPCSKECRLTASKVVWALLWAPKRAKESTAVFGGLLSACQEARHNCSVKTAAQTNSIGAHLGGLPQYGHIRILDARTAGPQGERYKTNASAEHDRIWMLKGIEDVLESLAMAKYCKAKARHRRQRSEALKPLLCGPVKPVSLSKRPQDMHVPAAQEADLHSQT